MARVVGSVEGDRGLRPAEVRRGGRLDGEDLATCQLEALLAPPEVGSGDDHEAPVLVGETLVVVLLVVSDPLVGVGSAAGSPLCNIPCWGVCYLVYFMKLNYGIKETIPYASISFSPFPLTKSFALGNFELSTGDHG